jgi:phage head maturation protease
MSKITKIYNASDVEVNPGKREVLAVISTDAIDRDNEVVQPTGIKRKNYAGNPVVMVNHDYQTLPVGKALWVKPDGNKVLAKYYISDKTETARDVFGLLQDGVLNAHSIGFLSTQASPPSTKEINARPDLKNARLIHRAWELLEFSVVGIPCNPEAVSLAVSKGKCSKTLLDFIGKPATSTLVKAASEKVASQITEETKDPKGLTRGQLEKMIAKCLHKTAIDIDPMLVVNQVIAQLTK